MRKNLFHKNFYLIIGSDIILIALGWYLSYLLRFNFQIPPIHFESMTQLFVFVVSLKLIVFYYFDLYRGMWRYTGISDLLNIIKASCLSSFLIIIGILLIHRFIGYARSVFIIDMCLTILLISGSRLAVRLYLGMAGETPSFISKKIWKHVFKKSSNVKNLLIVGAGDCGEKIYREIRDNSRLDLNVVAFVDDDTKKVGKTIHGIPILGKTSEIPKIVEKIDITEIIIAIPSATADQMRNIVKYCKESNANYKTVPGMGELINGNVTINLVREIAYRDLLGREFVKLDKDKIGSYLNNQCVLVTGAGGSIGSELCRQICRFNPGRVVLYERSESSLYDIELELKNTFPHLKIIALLGDIRDRQQLDKAFAYHHPRVIFHAAAYKHVPMMEAYPWKAIKNNIIGTRNMIDVSKKFMVERFVFVSTDKAVRPTNVMGASKRCAELLIQGQCRFHEFDTRFMTVRFGNVVGSAGSVIPLFKKQIAAGGPVTVTHPEVTRYFMTIPEACQLILQAGAMGIGGEIFILDMGSPIKIIDIARDLIKLSGFEPDVDISIQFIGLRPGEKLYEELITEGEGIVSTNHQKIMVLRGHTCEQNPLNSKIDELAKLAYKQDETGIITLLKKILPEYNPAINLNDTAEDSQTCQKKEVKNKLRLVSS